MGSGEGAGFGVQSSGNSTESPAAFMSPSLQVSKSPCLDTMAAKFCACYTRNSVINEFPLVVIVDRSDFASQSLENFLWTTFTRSDPASDVYGIESFVAAKHWGCVGSLVVDARSKPHHAPPLIEDPEVTRRVDALAAPGGPLHGIF